MTDASLAARRQEASDLFNDERFEAYLERMPGLETDEALRPMWLAFAASATWRLEQVDTDAWLERAIAAGFAQPELIPEGLQTHPNWEGFVVRMRANLPRPWVSLGRFPEFNTDTPLWTKGLSAERLERLLRLLPPVQQSAWETAKHLLSWTQQRWRHDGNNNAEDADALELLERSIRGERFRCVEYGILLAGALNARGIVARTCALKMPDYHAGTGRGHVVTEAWIDELQTWIVLDGQNGGYWEFDGVALGARELTERFWSGADAPDFVHLRDVPLNDASRRFWYPYFAYPQSGSALWIAPSASLTPEFQGRFAVEGLRVTRDASRVWTDLNGFELGFTLAGERPGLKLQSPHPACQGFEVNSQRFAGNPSTIPLEGFVGEIRLEVRAYTNFAVLRGSELELEW